MALTKDAFAGQVKEALLHLYDLAYLPQLELAHLLAGEESLTWQERTQRLRHVFIQAIERLDPGPHLPLRARERRSYAILSARYARSMTACAVMEELAISERQYWRERKRAIAALVDQLWDDYGQQADDLARSTSLPVEPETVAREEADLLISRSVPEEVSLGEIVAQAADALRKLIESGEIRLRVEGSDPSLLVFGDRTVLRQICLNILSHAFHIASGREVLLQISEQAETVEMAAATTTWPGDGAAELSDLGLKIVRRLVEAVSGQLEIHSGRGDAWSVVVRLPRVRSLPVLVIDDNAAIVKLFQRYLAGSKYRVIGAESGARALELIGQLRPAAVTLDVMMPAQDGWDTLQALRALPELADVPVIVCSILDEPQLALSLGADDFIRKPVQQTTLLQTLSRWVGHPEAAATKRPAATAGT